MLCALVSWLYEQQNDIDERTLKSVQLYQRKLDWQAMLGVTLKSSFSVSPSEQLQRETTLYFLWLYGRYNNLDAVYNSELQNVN